jgi:ABC-type transport system involved in cytochrome c biogenesis permease subunit
MYRRLLAFATSLKLTVSCLALAMILILAGTLAQVHLGLWEAQKQFFHSLIVFWTPPGSEWSIPVFPGGYLIGSILLVNLLATYIKSFRLSYSKAGILLIHAGIFILLVGQLLTQLLQQESYMRIEEGQSKTYSESTDRSELAIIRMEGGKEDVTVIPESVLLQKNVIRHDQLPFAIRVLEWSANSEPTLRQTARQPESTTNFQGAEDYLTFKPVAPARKMDEVNFPAATLEIIGSDRTVNWVVSHYLSMPEAAASLSRWAKELGATELWSALNHPRELSFGGSVYRLELRPARHYKFTEGSGRPVKFTLLDFRYDRYPGTDVARNFSSRIRLENPGTDETREVVISMNNPLRYGGETYYQASFDPRTEKATVLQVVRNPVWLAPYIACLVVAAGMTLHFLMRLTRFGRKQRLIASQDKSPQVRGPGWQPGLIAAVCVLGVLWQSLPTSKSSGFDIPGFGRLPVLLHGRVQPIDSMARNALLVISGKSVVRTDAGKMTAAEWLLEVMAKPEDADQRKIFRLENNELRAWLNANEGRFGFVSLQELIPSLSDIETRARHILAAKKEPQLRTGYERDLVHLFESIVLYQRLKGTIQPAGAQDFARDLRRLMVAAPVVIARLHAAGRSDSESEELMLVARWFERFQSMARNSFASVVAPGEGRAWKSAGAALMESLRTGEAPKQLLLQLDLLDAYRMQNELLFNSTIKLYETWLRDHGSGSSLKKAAWESYFNDAAFFYQALVLYVVAMLLACASWINASAKSRTAALFVLGIGLVTHSVGLVFRMMLEGRPPVTNLYSSAVFIGWGAVVFGLVLERVYRGGFGIVVGSIIGFVTLIIAHHLSLAGDTMKMLQAVLDTNLWLATHVVIVVTGYAAMFVAGLLGIIYHLRRRFTRTLTPETAGALARMAFGTICFATLFSFTGTVLGGIWADQSWGRFWGWDPKENGALLIVLWCAFMLHLRLGGFVRERGFMALAIFGNVITSFSWFGVNMLGIGLHSYGFMEGAFNWLLAFILSQCLLLALAAFPPRAATQ